MIRGLMLTCAALSICGLAATAQAQMENPQQARMVAQLMQQPGNVNLPTAIQTAEHQTKGQAINADAFVPPPWQTGGKEQLKYAITCLTPNNQFETVFIDARTGRVESVQPAMTAQRMGFAQPFSPSQQQAGYGGWPEQSWQGQPGWQPYPPQGYPSQAGYPGPQPQYGRPMRGMPMMWERVSEIMGATARNSQNQDLGKVENLAINITNGRVPFAILNLNDKLHPIPFRLIQLVGPEKVALNIPKDRAESLPVLQKDWPQMINARLAAAVNRNLGLFEEPGSEFGYAGFRAEEGGPPVPTTQPSPPGAVAPAGAAPAALTPIHRASDLMNKSVHNFLGESVGTVKDLVIDPQRGQLAYAIVSFHNMGDRLVAVPFDAFSFQQGRLILNTNPARLRAAQSLSFTPNAWPNISNPEFAEREAELWGTRPYLMMGPGRMMGPGGMMGGPPETRGGAPGQPGQPPTPPPSQTGERSAP